MDKRKGKQEKKPINEIIGMNIQRMREQVGLTQDELSSKIGMGVKSLSAIERGVTGISLSSLKRVCRELAVTSDSLIFGVPEEGEREAEIQGISEKLRQLNAKEYRIVREILIKVMEGMALSQED